MRKAFATAIAANDRTAVAKLARFPLAVEVFGGPPKLTQRKFLGDRGYFEGWFWPGDAGLVACLRKKPFVHETDRKAFGAGAWYLDCNGNEYYFGERAGTWALVGYQNMNE